MARSFSESLSEGRGCLGRVTVSLTWPNQDRLIVARGETGYEWVADRPSPRASASLGIVGEGQVTGTLAHGDALDVLDALVADGTLEAKSVRLVYIDPPFGTGKRFGHYNDQLAEAAWLSMLRDRLLALRPMLSRDASVWVHLDETMSHKARLILDGVFGSAAFVATVVWQKRLTVESRTAISSAHDPILIYAPSGPKHWKTVRNRVAGTAAASNRDGDPRGPWRDAPFTAPGFRSGQQYGITNPAGDELLPPRGRSWFATEPVFLRLLQEDRIWWTKSGAGQPRMKNFDIDALQVPGTIWGGPEVGTNDDAKRHLSALFPDAKTLFDTPKPETLLQRILHIATDPGDLVVDLFAGSGTTATTAHKMGRRWLVSERMAATVEDVLFPRLVKVVEGQDSGGVSAEVGWVGGGAFRRLVVPARIDGTPAVRRSHGKGRAPELV